MNQTTGRRAFLRSAAGAAAGTILPSRVLAAPGVTSPNEKLNIAVIGAGGQAYRDAVNMASENIVALCDVDEKRGAEGFRRFPKARRYRDYRRMLEREEKQIDAVVVACTDHVHIPASLMAMRLGKHVYCEKPLGQNLAEVRLAARVAAETGVVTQMGNGAHTGPNYRAVAKMIRDGIIGEVGEVHCWCDEAWAPGDRPKSRPPVPKHLDWDLWLGPAPHRPYHPTYHPLGWRQWWDFGNGRLGDMGCHMLDLPFMALDLGSPVTVEAESAGPAHPESAPIWLIARWTFPARGKLPPVYLTWYDGNKRPVLQREYSMPDWPEATLFVGAKGMLLADYGHFKLFPEERFAGVRRPQVPRKPPHPHDWIQACKENNPARPGCHFGYAGPLTETVLLGTVAFRSGEKLIWDANNLKIPNHPEAERFLRRSCREGWTL